MNHYPLWKNLLIAALLALGVLYALPNLYPDEPALQITGARSSIELDELRLKDAQAALSEAGIGHHASLPEDGGGIIRLGSEDEQLRAKEIVQAALGEDYIVAQNLAPTTPGWLHNLGGRPLNLGLDLRGGVHFQLEVDMAKAVEQRIGVYVSEIKSLLRESRTRYRLVRGNKDGTIVMKFTDAERLETARRLVEDEYTEFEINDLPGEDAPSIRLTLSDAKRKEIQDYAIRQNLTTLRNRVNELGVAEPLVQRQGASRIVVELPGVQDTALAKRVLGATANLEFRLEASPDAGPSSTETHLFRDEARGSALLERELIVTGDSVINAQANFDENGQPQVNISLDAAGGKRMNHVTRKAVQRRMAVLFLEYKSRVVKPEPGVQGAEPKRTFTVSKRIISLATIQEPLGNRFRITGLDSAAESSELALLLRAGSLAAPVYIVEERTIGPSLGKENIQRGLESVILGFVAVLLFIAVYYRVFGLFANVALAMNLVLIIAVMSLIGATLTLPGIAGIVLTVGMAVDANVLIYARIREELANGMTPQAAIHAGYDRAFLTILDANITTLLAALILFAVGTGPVKGFAVTLSIGIVTSMFTAIMVTRAMTNLVYGGRRLARLNI